MISRGIYAEMHKRHLELRRVVTLLNTHCRRINSFPPEGEKKNSLSMSRIKPSGSFNSFIRYTDINARSFYRYTLCFIRLRCQQKTKTYFDVATVSDNFCRSKFFPLYSRAIAAPLRTPFLSPHPNTSCGSSLAAVVKH